MLTTNQPTLSPVQSKNRINSLDIIRGIALLGILLMNIAGMGLPYSYSDPTVYGSAIELNTNTWTVTNIFFEGTMRGLFSMLFGAGIVLLTERLEKAGAGLKTADIYYRRIIWLFIIGLIHNYILLWEGEILYSYALCGLFLFTFRKTHYKKLIVSGLILLFLGFLWSLSEYHEMKGDFLEYQEVEQLKSTGVELSEDQEEIIKAWDKKSGGRTEEEIQEKIDNVKDGYWANVKSHVDTAQFMQTWVMYRYFFYDVLGFMLLGMGLFKLRVFHAERSVKTYIIMSVLGYLFGISINYYETQLILNNDFDILAVQKATLTYDIGRLSMTMGHIGLIMLIFKFKILKFLQNALSAVGRMALTNYLMHTIITMFIFYGFGFGLFGELERYQLYYIVLGIWIAQLIYSPIWLKYYKYGPFEWLWRSLTYSKIQPIKKQRSSE